MKHIIIGAVVLIVVFFVTAGIVYGATQTWDFTTSGDYTFDTETIEITAGQAQLKATSTSPTWYDTDWGARRPITIDNSGGEAFTNLQVEILLASSTFDFSKASSTGADIRVTDSDGTTLIDHWVEEFDTVNERGFIMTEVPSLGAGATKTIYIYYGNGNATTTSSWEDAFLEVVSQPATSTVYSNNLRYAAFPGALELANGDFIVVFRNGGSHTSTDGRAEMVRSTDGGSTWSSPTVVHDSATSTVDTRTNLGAAQISDGTVIVPFGEVESSVTIGAFTVTSTDNGVTWGTPVEIPPPADLTDANAFPYGKVIELSDGTLLVPTFGRNSGGNFGVWLFASSDKGASWSERGTIAAISSANYNETSVLALDDSNLIAILRRESGVTTQSLYKSVSTDGGATWSAPTFLFEGVSPDLIELSDGKLLLCHGDRSGSDEGIRCRISEDDGANWTPGMLLYEGFVGQASNGGYPSSLQLANGDIFTAFYYQPDEESNSNTDIASITYSPGDVLNPNAYSFLEDLSDGVVSDWTTQGSSVVATTTQEHSSPYSILINDQDSSIHTARRELGGNRYFLGTLTYWVYPETYEILTAGLLDGTISSSDERFWLAIQSTGALQWFNGSSYQDPSGGQVIIPQDEWSKITIKFNMAENTGDLFVNGVSKGTIGTRFAGSGISHFYMQSFSSAGTGYTFYTDDIYTYRYSSTTPSIALGSETLLYATTTPTITPTVGNIQAFTNLSGFSASTTPNGGDIQYQVSNNSGTTWYWYDSGWSTTVLGYAESSPETTVNTNIATLPTGDGEFLWRAYLSSNGAQQVQMDEVMLTYENDASGPVLSSISANPGDTTATVTWSTDESADSTVEYGETSSYGSSTTSPSLFTSHSLTITGLTTCTTYHYRVSSTDGSSNTTTSSDQTFTTTSCSLTTPSGGGSGSGPSSAHTSNQTANEDATDTPPTEEETDAAEQQRNDLFDLIETLRGQIAALTREVSFSSCPRFTTNHERGDAALTVSDIQWFLRDQGLFTYPEITTYYGPITEGAVRAFQETYATEILAPLNLAESTGNWFERTRAQANMLVGC